MHEEMPQPLNGEMDGFQLWVNLPAKLKMTKPRYLEITSNMIPEIEEKDGVQVRVIAGVVDSIRGPVTEIAADPTYIDVTIPPGGSFSHSIYREHNAFAYVFEGEGTFGITEEGDGKSISHTKLIVFGNGDGITIQTQEKPVRFLLVSGIPLNEPIARYGPFVMNTKEEIEQALRDLQNGTFIQD
jgi:redox-sensitive bicupin YhaK (pirin superfamily)